MKLEKRIFCCSQFFSSRLYANAVFNAFPLYVFTRTITITCKEEKLKQQQQQQRQMHS